MPCQQGRETATNAGNVAETSLFDRICRRDARKEGTIGILFPPSFQPEITVEPAFPSACKCPRSASFRRRPWHALDSVQDTVYIVLGHPYISVLGREPWSIRRRNQPDNMPLPSSPSIWCLSALPLAARPSYLRRQQACQPRDPYQRLLRHRRTARFVR